MGFISSHVKQITMAEIGSQNVNAIDREVNRLYDAWKSTQDADIKIQVLLDGKLVSKAGQLSAFGPFSFKMTKTDALPSGQKLDVGVDVDLASQILFDVLLMTVFCLFLAGCFLLLKRSLGRSILEVSKPLEDRVDWIEAVARGLPASIQIPPPYEPSSITEMHALDGSLQILTDQIILLEERVSKASFQEGRIKTAELVAHSIKGALGLLRLRIENANGLSGQDRDRLTSAVNEVANASRDLLQNRKLSSLPETHFAEPIQVGIVVDEVIAQKIEMLNVAQAIDISVSIKGGVSPVVYANESELRAVFSNIIDNAIDATGALGQIVVHIDCAGNNAVVSIRDNGRGIPADILPRLMNEGETHGKTDGNGLGLFHARQIVERFGGSIRLSSLLGQGTEVLLKFPLVVQPINKDLSIPLRRDQTLVVFDDDQSIHGAVDLILGGFSPAAVVHLHSVSEFEAWMSENGFGEMGSRVYWMDFDAGHKSLTGLGLIKKYSLQFESYLITGMADDAAIQLEAKEARVKLISKNSLPKIKFEFESLLAREAWGLDARATQ
jgi:signal transduction histidine kinase